MDENIAQNPPQEPVSYTRPNNSSPKFFDKFFSFFTKKTTAVLVILVLIIGVGVATIAVQRSTEIRQRAATNPPLIPGCGSLGDVNGDGQINPIDSTLILQFSAGTITFTSAQKVAADVNGDGQVNPIDSTLILQYAAGLITTFPGCSSVISGTVFIDNNGNGVQDSGETDYPGTATIKLENGVTATKAFGTGYFFTGVASGKHIVTLTVPTDYTVTVLITSGISNTSLTSFSVTVPPNGTFKWGIKTGTIAPTTSPIPDCNSGGSCTACVAASNTCNGTGTKKCILDSLAGSPAGTKCNISKPIEQACTGAPANCSSGSSCQSGVCVLPNGSPAPTPSINCDSGGSCTACVAASNTCNGTGTKRCILNSLAGSPGTACINVSVTNPCTGAPANCSSGSSCQSGVCVLPNGSPAPTSPPGTVTPAPTGTQGGTQLALSIGLDAIGNTGDNGGPNGTRSEGSTSNKNPKRPTRNVTVEIFDSNSNKSVGTAKTGTIAYTNGVFTGTVNLGGVASGSYNIKVKSDGYLRRQVLGVVLTAGQTNTLPKISLVVGDIDGNNAINILDINILISCSTTTLSTDSHQACNANSQYAVLSDLDDNGTVDLSDANLLIREFSVQNGD